MTDGSKLLCFVYAVALGAATMTAIRQHDHRVLSEAALARTQAVAVQTKRDQDAAIAALEQRAIAAEQRATSSAHIHEVIHNVPITRACSNSPAIRAAIDGLRSRASVRPGDRAPSRP